SGAHKSFTFSGETRIRRNSASPSVRAKLSAPSADQLRESLRVSSANSAKASPSTGSPASTSTRTLTVRSASGSGASCPPETMSRSPSAESGMSRSRTPARSSAFSAGDFSSSVGDSWGEGDSLFAEGVTLEGVESAEIMPSPAVISCEAAPVPPGVAEPVEPGSVPKTIGASTSPSRNPRHTAPVAGRRRGMHPWSHCGDIRCSQQHSREDLRATAGLINARPDYTPELGVTLERTHDIQHGAPELTLVVDQAPEKVAKPGNDALAKRAKGDNGAALSLTDTKGRHVRVPAGSLGYIEIGAQTPRPVGF